MKILGFSSDPTTPRYAVVDGSAAPLTLLNADTESRLRFPADCSTDAVQVTWLYREFERIFHTHPDITKVVIKKGEFTQSDNNAKRLASYQEAALLLHCGLHNKPAVTKIYASLATRSAQVKDHAIARVGQRRATGMAKWPMRSLPHGGEQQIHECRCHHAPDRRRSLVT
jgi:glucose dehydrogenase